ncbi:hypothetical protein KM043_002510 [Ampulex compressa]|nr:hypothetical protein KM043_002510 [Ampulex compressa]
MSSDSRRSQESERIVRAQAERSKLQASVKSEEESSSSETTNSVLLCELRAEEEAESKKPSPNCSIKQETQAIGTTKEVTEFDRVLDRVKNTCPLCDRRFEDEKMVERHVNYVHQKPYKCDKCKRACYTERALLDHKKTHRPDYYFECKICHVRYMSEDGLRRHEVRTHSEHESKYVCEHCGRSYKLKIDLSLHMKRTHVLELQVCRFCGKEVKDVKGHEWRHQKRNREVEYEYSCHLCRKKFHHRSRLDNHLRLHEKGFKCEECGKEYRGTRELMSHKRFKHGQAPVSTCVLCKRSFASISNYYQHVLTHAGIRPYKCDVCEEDFTQRSSLLRHRKHHPGVLPHLPSTNPQIAELARRYLQKLQTDQIDKSSVLNTGT